MKIRSMSVQCVQSTAAAVLLTLCGQALGQAAVQGPAAQAAGGEPIQWKSGSPSPTWGGADKVLAEQAGRHVVVQLTRVLTDAGRAELAGLGVTLLAPLGNATSYFAVVDAGVNVGAVAKSPWLAGAAAVRPEWKLSPMILGGDAAQAHNTITPGADPVVAVYVLLHEDVAAADVAPALAAKHGGQVINAIQSLNGVVVHAPVSALGAIAAEDGVQWIEPAMPKLGELNAQNRVLTGTDTVNAAPYNLNGTGVRVLVFDGGTVRRTHLDFQNRVTLIDTATTSSHATHVAGTVGGGGVINPANRGMAPGVTILSAGVNTGGVSGWLYSNPVDIEADYTVAYTQGAHLATNSIGTNTAPNGFDCKWEGDYSVTDSVIDRIVRGNSTATQNNPFRVIWAAGNERGSGRCGTNFRTTAPPACGKNHIVVGSVDSNTDNTSSFSSWGPTDDGRMKPDISAPGCQTDGDAGVTSTTSTSDTSYGVNCGTSMATPTVAGITSLLLQDYRAQFPATADPRNSTLKALYAHSATDRGNAGPDFIYGYGSVRAPAAIDLMRTGNFREVPVSVGGDVHYTVQVASGTSELKLTLGWDDPSGTANVVPALVNDLDLEVYSPSRVRAYPWTLQPDNGNALAARTQRNTRDNLEQVDVDNPEAGTWTIRIRGTNVPTGPQVASLVSSHTLTDAAAYATVAVDSVVAPSVMAAGVATPVVATLSVQNDTVVGGSVQLMYRASGAGAFTPVAMTVVSGTTFEASLPAFACGDAPQFYVSAMGQTAGAVLGETLSCSVGTEVVYFSDNMEAATPVWTIAGSATGATTGRWERGDPERTGSQPEDDTTPNGVNCWVTGRLAGTSQTSNEVDGSGGTTELTSPTFSMEGATPDTVISYMRWFHTNNITNYTDPFVVTISNNNGSTWTAFETLAAGSPVQLGWRQVSRTLGSVGITPTAQMKLRFLATDVSPTTTVEAAIDDLKVSRVSCVATPSCGTSDFNGDGDFGTDADIEAFFACLAGNCCATCFPGGADFNGDGDTGTDADIEAFFRVLAGGNC
jgi:hypothetical protein